MMQHSERAIETSSAFADAERDRQIQRAQAKLALEGEEYCAECGEEIPAGRRAALPSATRCLPCQTAFERPRR